MKFDPQQGVALHRFMSEVGVGMVRALKPGGFAVVFSQPRLAHRMAVGLEDAGFEIRDLYAWRFTKRAQAKAFTLNHFVDRMQVSAAEKARIKRHLGGRRTPQLRPQFEAMVLAQRPRDGTFLNNWRTHETGLINWSASLNDSSPSTVMTVEKPDRERFNGHLTVKPVPLIEHLIELFSLPGQTVLDPFLGSGTTAIAAAKTRRHCRNQPSSKHLPTVTIQASVQRRHSDRRSLLPTRRRSRHSMRPTKWSPRLANRRGRLAPTAVAPHQLATAHPLRKRPR